MCERGWDINVVFLSTASNFPTYLIQNCTRVGSPIGIQIHKHPLEIGVRLAYESRSVLKAFANDYSVFAYQEDDIIVTGEQVWAYLKGMDNLDRASLSSTHMIGFSGVYRKIDELYPVTAANAKDEDYLNTDHNLKAVCINGTAYAIINQKDTDGQNIFFIESLCHPYRFLNAGLRGNLASEAKSIVH